LAGGRCVAKSPSRRSSWPSPFQSAAQIFARCRGQLGGRSRVVDAAARLDDHLRRRELGRALLADVLEPRDLALAVADEQVDVSVAVPVGAGRTGVAADLDVLARGLQVVLLAEGEVLRVAFIGDEPDVAADVGDDQVHVAIGVPVDRMDGRRGAGDRERLAGLRRDLAVVHDDRLAVLLTTRRGR
jgi:hypothetical protein